MVEQRLVGSGPPDRRMADIRVEYETDGLAKAETHPDPVAQFDRWLAEAVESGVPQANAMTLATAGLDGQPSARVVLLKGYGEEGFVFYTNLESRKSRELRENPRASLCFLWLDLHRQVRIEGSVGRVEAGEADRYFDSRPRDSRIAASVSPQSREVPDRATLERMMEEVKDSPDQVYRPSYWGGWRVRPDRFEFWQGRLHRLHDRIVYLKEDEGWRRIRLAP
ncbi:MAG: pyridoxamine 5'-phosphate oxidase [bacterium]|nr:pyridoxamine 5'-phosphate oxidase [bacterium]MCY3652101.1 pyridoxamine 5'-phosphate oxidase [bacterium]MDE0642912.1 pyridoxamine 5'-phosphate oxidase [bacterium]